jgi:hypothetical protein
MDYIRQVAEDPESFSKDAPHNVGLPTLRWRRPDPKSKTGLESLESNFKRFYVPGGMYDISKQEGSARISELGGPGLSRVESLPEDRLRRNIEAIRAAKELGYEMPEEVYDPAFLSALMIKEGRSDLGSNASFTAIKHNKKAVNLYKDLAERFGEAPAMTAALMYDKGRVAKRIKKPFPMVWNGIGVLRDEEGNLHASGELYAKSFPRFIEAAKRPENKELFDFVNTYLKGDEYTSPLTKQLKEKLSREHDERGNKAYKDTLDKIKSNKLRSLQYDVFGTLPLVGVPEEYNPVSAREKVQAPDFEKLKRQLVPEYRSGGVVKADPSNRRLI